MTNNYPIIEFEKSVYIIICVLLSCMFMISYIVIDRVIAENLYSFHCQIRVDTQEASLTLACCASINITVCTRVEIIHIHFFIS